MAKSKGQRLTALTWDIISSVPKSTDVISYKCLSIVMPSDAMGLQILMSVEFGDMEYSHANILTIGSQVKDGIPCWYSRGTVNDWAKVGKSSSHFVFLYHLASSLQKCI